jgi:hypothetical protein
VVQEVDLEPATADEIAATVAVMGGEDWEFWVDALQAAGVLAPGFKTMSYTYIGTDLTWPIYWHATLGKAKEDLDRAARAITKRLAALKGEVRIAVLKFVVSQASSAIPVVPLYGSLLYRVMKDAGVHETTIEQIDRLFRTQVYAGTPQRLDNEQRIRMDDIELTDAIQADVKRRWPIVSTENLATLADLDGFRADFLKIFGFGSTASTTRKTSIPRWRICKECCASIGGYPLRCCSHPVRTPTTRRSAIPARATRPPRWRRAPTNSSLRTTRAMCSSDIGSERPRQSGARPDAFPRRGEERSRHRGCRNDRFSHLLDLVAQPEQQRPSAAEPISTVRH